MSYLLTSTVQPTLGIQPRYLIVRCRNNSTAITANQLVRLDMSVASEEPGLGSVTPGTASNSKWANVTIAAANNAVTESGLYGVAQEAISASGGEGLVMFAGITAVNAVAATYAAGNSVGLPGASGTAGSVARVHTFVRPIGFVVTTTAASATSARVMLDGSLSFALNPT